MAAMSIGEVARQAGVQPSTVRYYESIGLLPAPSRVSGRRRYPANVLQRLAIIQTGKQAGFTLSELRLLLDDILDGPFAPDQSLVQWHELIQRKLQEMNTLLSNIQSMKSLLEDMMGCADDQLADCIYITGQRHKVAAS